VSRRYAADQNTLTFIYTGIADWNAFDIADTNRRFNDFTVWLCYLDLIFCQGG